MMDRRGFLGSILAAAVAPAIVRADSLMRLLPQETLVLAPTGIVMPVSEALFAGAIREWHQFDIYRDEMLCRFDVAWRAADGTRMQEHIFYRDAEPADVREGAIATLRKAVRDKGGTPVRGVLELPQGAHFAQFC